MFGHIANALPVTTVIPVTAGMPIVPDMPGNPIVPDMPVLPVVLDVVVYMVVLLSVMGITGRICRVRCFDPTVITEPCVAALALHHITSFNSLNPRLQIYNNSSKVMVL